MSTTSLSKTSPLGATVMVAGCCIGAGMIGMPVLSAAAGFFPSFLALLFSYAFTTCSGLLVLEATLWFDKRVNLLSMAQFALGRFGKLVAGGLFAFLFYALFVAYLDGGGRMFSSALSALSGLSLSREVGIVICLLAVMSVIQGGIRRTDQFNRILMIGLALSYTLIIAFGTSHIRLENLEHMEWSSTLATLPILFICFGYQNLVPSITDYLKRNVAAIRLAIIVGNFIPLLFYLLWNFVILGMISDPMALQSESGLVTHLMKQSTHVSSILFLVDAFAFFALLTSFITVSFSFVDFLRDGFKSPPSSLALYLIAFLPPLVISLWIPNLFLKALSFAGGFIDILLYGILPVCMVWVGRYVKKIESPYRVPGGKALLIAVVSISALLLVLNVSR
jgi:tyrosine-specific transport protein